MTAVQKRRASNRMKTQRPAKLAVKGASKGTKVPWRPKDWVRDVVSLGFLAAGILLLLSLGSHFYLIALGRSFGPETNLMGPTGHIVATLLQGWLGWAAILPVCGLVWLAFFRPVGAADEIPKRYSLGSVVLAGLASVVFLSALLSMASGPLAGGGVGTSLYSILSRWLGSGGALLSVALCLSVAGAVLCQRTVGDVASGIRWGGCKLASFVFVSVPRLTFALTARGVLTLWVFTWTGIRALWRSLFAKSTVNQKAASGEGIPAPKPRLRKNIPVPESEQVVVALVPTAAPSSSVTTGDRAEPIIVKPKTSEAFSKGNTRTATKKVVKSDSDKAPLGAPEFDDYAAPDVHLLAAEDSHEAGEDDEELRQKAEQIESKLRDFNIAGRVTQVHPGPVITLFEFEPAPGVKVGRIAALQDDLSMSLKASSIRIIAPIPKRGTVGIEVPNKNRAVVRLRDCLESEAFATADSTLSVPLGKDTYGDAVVVDIATMPHLLMAGATGTGKSVCINALLLSLLYRAHPSELGLILIDPKVLELSIYDGIPHLRVPVVTDPRQAKAVLSWAVKEMDRRYRYMQRFGVRNIDGYNQVVRGEPIASQAAGVGSKPEQVEINFGEPPVSGHETEAEQGEDSQPIESVAPEQLKPLPKLVIVIDELADLMLSVGREIEDLITRLAQKARAAGIHLIVATQRPSVDVITGLIKANFPARLSFRVSSRIDSRTILDAMGAEKLLGKGDMLFMLPGAVPLKRIHGAFVSDQEVQRVVQSLKTQCGPKYDEAIVAACEKALTEDSGESGGGSDGENGAESEDFDPFYDKAVELVIEKGQASTSMIQRAFRIGYNRAARIIEMMEREGVVSKMDGVRPREILAPPIDRDSPN
jgi:S-DNA-T family DNA segregation ATPase FtsK/SpoIIIE